MAIPSAWCRRLQGDCRQRQDAVAFLAILPAASPARRAALMRSTDLLARPALSHHLPLAGQPASGLLPGLSYRPLLPRSREDTLAGPRRRHYPSLRRTHAWFRRLSIADLALAVVDGSIASPVHAAHGAFVDEPFGRLLVMTATGPIPRTPDACRLLAISMSHTELTRERPAAARRSTAERRSSGSGEVATRWPDGSHRPRIYWVLFR